MMKRRLLTCLVGGALGVCVVGLRLIAAQQVELTVPDTQKLLMENAFVRVFEIRVPPGTFEARHGHARGLTIALSDYDNETRAYPDGQLVRRHATFGEVRWAEPVVHEARNVGTTEQHVIRIELK